MGCYKFLYREDVHWLTQKGSLKFGRLRYYQLLEIASGRAGIGDRLEGAAVTPFKNLPINDATPAPIKDFLGQSGMAIGPNAAMNFSGAFEVDIDCYVLSLSVGPFEKMVDAMTRNCPPEEAYNACVEISDLQKLAEIIEREGTFNGEPITRFFNVKLCKVQYNQPVDHPLSPDGIIVRGNPCKKQPQFLPQQEWRIILFFKEDWQEKPPHLTVIIPDPASIFIRRKIPNNKIDKPQPLSEEATIRAINRIRYKTRRIIERKFPYPEGLKRREWFDAVGAVNERIEEFFKPTRSKLCAHYMRLMKTKSWAFLEDSFLDYDSFTQLNWNLEEYLRAFPAAKIKPPKQRWRGHKLRLRSLKRTPIRRSMHSA